MNGFVPRMWDDNAVTAYLKRYVDADREIASAKKRLERLEYQAARDARFMTGIVKDAIEADRERLSGRIADAQKIKEDVVAMLELLPDGDERRALELYYLSGMRIPDIAETMHYSIRSVCNLKERGVKLLIEKILEGDISHGGQKSGKK